MKKLDLLVTGVGGQGVILASDIISEVALAVGYDVKKTDTLGMAQRGGGVLSHVRIAPKVWSPLARQGEVDIIIGFEKMETARWGYYLREGGVVVVNNHVLPPLAVNLGYEQYPTDEKITAILKQRTDRIYFVDGTARARELGNVRTLNMFMLGCASALMPVKVSAWKEVIAAHLPPVIREINIGAFNEGRKEIRGVHI